MAVPQRVPIARGAGYRTDTIGHYRHGQFYAAVRSAHRDDDQAPDRGRGRIRRYAPIFTCSTPAEATASLRSR